MFKFIQKISNSNLIKEQEDYSKWVDIINNEFSYLIEEDDKEVIFIEDLFINGENLSDYSLKKIEPIMEYCKSTEKDFKIPLKDLSKEKVSLLENKLKDLNFSLKNDYFVKKFKDMKEELNFKPNSL